MVEKDEKTTELTVDLLCHVEVSLRKLELWTCINNVRGLNGC